MISASWPFLIALCCCATRASALQVPGSLTSSNSRTFSSSTCWSSAPWFILVIIKINSVAKSCLTFCNPMDCRAPGSPVLHYLLEFAQSFPLSQWCSVTISSSVAHFSSCPQSFPASGSFPVSWFFESGDQSIGASASVSSVQSLSHVWLLAARQASLSITNS